MDRDQLLAFERVAHTGSFSAAARALDLTQPTITARIQTLEREVGGPLFVRGGRNLELTERGASFLPYARRILELVTEAVEAAEQTEKGQQGRVRIGVTESLTGGFLAAALARLYQSHPQVEIFFRTGHSDQVAEMLHAGTVKLGLLTWPHFNPDLAPLLVFKEPLVLVGPKGHPLAQAGPVTIAELIPYLRPFLLLRWGEDSMKFVSQLNLPNGQLVEVPIETTRYLLRHGQGISLLTKAIAADDLAAGLIEEIRLKEAFSLYRETALVRLAQASKLPPLLDEFISLLAEEARQLGLQIAKP